MKQYEQLNLLNYISEPGDSPLPPQTPPSAMSATWWQRRADYHLTAISKLMQGDRRSREVHQHEITLLYALRAVAQLQANCLRERNIWEAEFLFNEEVINDEK